MMCYGYENTKKHSLIPLKLLMKICFLLQRRWAIIGHSMAHHIQKNFENTDFCAVVQMRPSLEFLQKQREVTYTSLILEEDLHKELYNEKIDLNYLNSLEKEYGIPNLWPYLYIDRVIMHGQLVREYPYNKPLLSHEDMMRRVQVTARAIIKFLEKEKPDAVVISVIGSVGSALLYYIAKKKGIQVINLELTRIKNRIAFSEDFKTFSWAKKYFEEIQGGRISHEKKNAEQYLKEFRDHPAPYHQQASPTFNNQALRRAHIQFLAPKKLAWSLMWHVKTLISDIKQKKKNNDYTNVFVWWSTWDKLKRKTRGLRDYSDLYTPVDQNDVFAFYPLHYDPEMATMLYAPYYTDQLQLIKAIARSLPLHMKLYVKEHAAMLGYRPRSYYKELLKIPNVKLINPTIGGYDLARTAAITITITGTGGWESLVFKKPVITFGDIFYGDIPGVKRCRGFEELPHLIKDQLENWQHDEKTLVDYISALLEDSVPIDYIDLWSKAGTAEEIIENEGITELSRVLAEKIGLQKRS